MCLWNVGKSFSYNYSCKTTNLKTASRLTRSLAIVTRWLHHQPRLLCPARFQLVSAPPSLSFRVSERACGHSGQGLPRKCCRCGRALPALQVIFARPAPRRAPRLFLSLSRHTASFPPSPDAPCPAPPRPPRSPALKAEKCFVDGPSSNSQTQPGRAAPQACRPGTKRPDRKLEQHRVCRHGHRSEAAGGSASSAERGKV